MALIHAFNVRLSAVVYVFKLRFLSITLQWLKFHLFLAYLQLCDFGFARAMSANTVVLRSIKGIYFSS
jgi:hypothetical protein